MPRDLQTVLAINPAAPQDFAPGMPRNPPHSVRIPQGSDVRIKVYVTDPSGVKTSLHGKTLSLTFGLPGAPIATVAGVIESPDTAGVAHFDIDGSQTAGVVPARLLYQVTMTDADGTVTIIEPAAFVLVPSVVPQ